MKYQRLAGLVGAATLALATLMLLSPAPQSFASGPLGGQHAAAVTASNTPVSASPSATTPTTQTSSVKLSTGATCEHMPDHGSAPYIQFCSPSFDGNVEGPWGAHVTAVGGNFKAPIQAIFLATAQKSGLFGCAASASSCLSFENASKMADVLALLKQTPLSQFTVSFTWTFSPSLAAAGSNYYIVAEDQGGKIFASSLSFTLLSSQAPCIVVATTTVPTSCGSSTVLGAPLQVVEGDSIVIAGYGWLPSDTGQSITVDLQCATCAPKQVKLGTLAVSKDDGATPAGSLPQTTVTLPAGVTGTYRVYASNDDQSITFGDTSVQPLTLAIAPHPCVAVGGSCGWSGADVAQSVAKGQTTSITGQNWLPGSTVSVYFVPGDVTAANCGQKLSTALAKPQTISAATGGMSGSVSLPSKLQVGQEYTMCASGHSSLGANAKVEYAAIHVKVTKAVAHPTLTTLAMLAIVFSVIGAGVFVVTMPRRAAAVPQAVSRR